MNLKIQNWEVRNLKVEKVNVHESSINLMWLLQKYIPHLIFPIIQFCYKIIIVIWIYPIYNNLQDWFLKKYEATCVTMNDFSNEVEPLTWWSKALSICHLLKFLFFLNVLQLARLQNALRLPRKIISKQSKAGGRGLKLGMVQKNTAGKFVRFEVQLC